MTTATRPSFDQLYVKYHSTIVRFLTYKTGHKSDAEEIANDALLKVYNNYDSFDPELAIEKTWVYTIVNNTLIDYYRKTATVKGKGRKCTISTDNATEDNDNAVVFQVPDKGIKADSLFDQAIVQNNIESALNTLKPVNKGLAVDFFINDFSHAQLVEKYNLPLNTVKVTLLRIRQKLQNALSGEYQMLCA